MTVDVNEIPVVEVQEYIVPENSKVGTVVGSVKVFEIIAKHELSVDLVTTSEISVSFTLDNPPNSVAERLNRETIVELQDICDVTVERGFDLITVVGNNMQTSVGVSSKILSAVSDYQLRMICFGANPHNMSFLVQEQHSDEIVKQLHRVLFE